jgi:hypothetical protein
MLNDDDIACEALAGGADIVNINAVLPREGFNRSP